MTDIEYQIECLSRDLILLIMEQYNVEMKEAFDMLYTSETYAKLRNPRSGLYFQSPVYVFDFLKNEIVTGRMR